MADPVAKKSRVWNPAVDGVDVLSGLEEGERPKSHDKPMDYSMKNPQQLPVLLQNYFNLAPLMARMQQQRHMEEMMRRHQMMTSLAAQAAQAKMIASTLESQQKAQTATRSSAPSVTSSVSNNPIVQSVLGAPIVAENCCAVCGTGFRLIGDLVQHVRNNHRRTRFKRKNEKTL